MVDFTLLKVQMYFVIANSLFFERWFQLGYMLFLEMLRYG